MPNRQRFAFVCAVFAVLVAAPVRAFNVQSGIGFVAITGSAENTEYVLFNAQNAEVDRGLADSFGSLVFRDLTQGAAYTIQETGGGSSPVTVRRFEDHPDQSFYASQPPLVEGLNYIQ